MTKYLLAALLVFSVSGIMELQAQGNQESPKQLELGFFPNLTHAPALVGVAEGFFQKNLGAGISVDVKTFNAGPSMIEALFAGEIDIGYIGPNPAINGYVKSGGKALKIIAGSSSGGALFVVRKDSGINEKKDLKSKKLASPQLGNTQDVALRSYIAECGFKTLDKGGDIQITPTENAVILTLFMQKEIDGAWVPEPWATRLVAEAGGKIFLDERSIWPGGKFVTAHVIVNTQFLEKYPGTVKKFLCGHVESVEFINRNPVKARKIVNEQIKKITTKAIPEDILQKSMDNMEITYDPVSESLKKSAKDAFSLGFLGKKEPDLSKIYSLGLLNEVLVEKGLAPVVVK